ncbi:hypothetical protein D3261_03565 [Halococcus sp. IIIV-5B]|nr:hypothetical protein D3261_03565 [Halococcus sp. IIIV-5B]
MINRRRYLQAFAGVPLVAAGVSGCLANETSQAVQRALTAQQLGEAWSYTEGGSPTALENGTITANYRSANPYIRTVRLRLWPCEGETLDALGGDCSLGNLPDQMRANQSVMTADRALGETTFLWWTETTTDIEVVISDHVFRLTHTPSSETNTDTTQEVPSTDARIGEITDIAQRQADKLSNSSTD